jgi:hypothetical protein
MILCMGVLCVVRWCVAISTTAPQLSISQKALGTVPEDGNVMLDLPGATIRN